MARLYSRKKGKSGSTKPLIKKKLPWVKYKAEEINSLIIKLGKQELKPSQIGLILRDSYGIPDVKFLTNKKITQILKENKIVYDIPEDLVALIKKQIQIIKHFEKNKQDQTAKRGLQLTESKINRLIKYYKKSGKLAKDWKYDKHKARLLVGS